MTVIAYYGNGYQAEGYYSLDFSSYAQGSLVVISVPGLISEDVATIPGWSFDGRQYYARWSLLFNAGTLLPSSALKSSALPAYIIGSANVYSDGYVTDSFFLNYQAQRSETYSCWVRGANYRFPHKYNPSIFGNGDIDLQLEALPSLRKYGKSACIVAPNVDYATTSATIIYSCIVSSNYPSTEVFYSNF